MIDDNGEKCTGHSRLTDKTSTWKIRYAVDQIHDVSFGDFENLYNRYTVLMGDQLTFS